MEFMDHLYQFGQFGILTFRDGIQEVGGLISVISSEEHTYLHLHNGVFLCQQDSMHLSGFFQFCGFQIQTGIQLALRKILIFLFFMLKYYIN